MEETRIVQITSGKGPAECEQAVAFALREFLNECNKKMIKAKVMSKTDGSVVQTLSSVTVQVKGKEILPFLATWEGVLQWTSRSPFRPKHKRKNWYVAIHTMCEANDLVFHEKDIEFKTMRASGPGGQHVNKTESAVRALHKPSGIFVTASESRSQKENKKSAIEKLKEKVKQRELNALMEQAVSVWLNHHYLERGKPKRVYEGSDFVIKQKGRSRDNDEAPKASVSVNSS